MPIKITPEPDIHITQAELERMRPEYEASQRMTVRPVSFETWLNAKQRGQKKPTEVGGRPLYTFTRR